MFGFDPAVIGIFSAVAITVIALCYTFLFPSIETKSKTNTRISKVSSADSEIAGVKAAQSRVQEASKRRKSVQNSLTEFEKQQKEKTKKNLTLKSRLNQAGMNITTGQFYVYSCLPALFITLLMVFTGVNLWVSLGALFVIALGLPRWFLNFKIKKRQRNFLDEFPNALEVIVRSLRSGLPLNDAIRMVAADGKDPVKTEFIRVIESQQLGLSIPDAVARMANNMPLQEVNFFITVIGIQAQSGGNLSEVIGNLARVLRDRKKMLAKVQALSMEAKASAWILGILPIAVGGLIQVSSPAYLAPLFTDPRGHMILIGAAFWMGMGILTIKRMINFDV